MTPAGPMPSRARTPRARRLAHLALVGALGLAALGCSSTSTTSTGGTGSTGSTRPGRAGTTGATGATGATGGTAAATADLSSIPVVSVVAKEDGATYSFDAPASIGAGLVMFDLRNEGKLPHQVNVARPKAGATIEQIQQVAQGPNPELAGALVEFVGASNTVDPGGSQRTVSSLEPGSYLLLCFVPDAEGTTDHLSHGMMRTLTVTAPTGTTTPTVQRAQMDEATVGEIAMKDFAITLPEPFTGKGWYRVTNDGPQPHEATLIHLAPGSTSKDALAFLTADAPSGPPPFQEVGGFAGLDEGNVGWVELDLPAGDYVALCFIPNALPDPATGAPDLKPHFAHGMTTPFTIS